jgi:exonuclease VII large subunit
MNRPLLLLRTMTSRSWILLTYKVPAEPSAKRLALWRRLKSLGAVYLQNGVCVLPKTDEHVRRLKVLENDIATMQGECVLLETVALDKAQEDKVIARFTHERNDQYQELLGRCRDFEAEIDKEISIQKFTYAELDEEETDLKKLESWYEKIQKLDFYGAPLAQIAQERLQACRARLEAYAQMVYDAHEENR